MKISLPLFCAAMLTAVHVFAADETIAPEKKPGLMHRLMHPFGGGESSRKADSAPTPAPEKKSGIVNRVLHPFGGKKD